MTVNTTKITSGPYPGNDIADTFSYGFRVEDKTQLIVFETDDTGVETTLVVDTDYTVAGIGVDAGGIVTRTAGALPTGYVWYIRSDYKETQLTAFGSQGGFFPDVHEAAMDKLTFLIQQIDDILGRSFRLSDSYTGDTLTTLPDPESEKYLRWKSDLSGFENVLLGTSNLNLPIHQLSTYGTLSAAITALGSTNAELWIDQSDTSINSPVTVPVNVTLRPVKGYVLGGSSSVTINGPFICGDHQAFDSSITVIGLRDVTPQYWGENTGVSDDTSAIQSAYIAINNTGVGSVRFSGTYNYAATIFVGSNTRSYGDGFAYIRRLATIPSETGERPNESGGGVPSHFVTFHALSTYRHSVAVNAYTIWATPVPDVTLVADQHENIVFENLWIEGTATAGTPSVTDNINTFEMEAVKNLRLEGNLITDAIEIGVRAAGSGLVADDGLGENSVIKNNTFERVEKAIEASENQQSIFVSGNTAKVDITELGFRASDCALSVADGNDFVTAFESVYYSVQGHHMVVNNSLDVTTSAERVVRIDGATASKPRATDVNVIISNNTIKRGNISFATESANIKYVSISGNNFLNLDGRIGQGNDTSTFFGAGLATNFIALGSIQNLFVDQDLPTAVDNSTYARYKVNTGEQEVSGLISLSVGLSGDQVAGTSPTKIQIDTDSATGNALFDKTGALNKVNYSIDTPPTGYYSMTMNVTLATTGLAVGDRIDIYCQEIGGTNPIIARKFHVVADNTQIQTIDLTKEVLLTSNKNYEFYIDTNGATGPTIRSSASETCVSLSQHA